MIEKLDTAGIIARTNLTELVARYAELKPNGREYVALCVAHVDSNPSMTISPDKGFVHCFACGFHQDAIGFVMHVEGVDFKTACKKLTNGDATGLPNPKPIAQRVLKKPPARKTFAPPPDAPPPEFEIRSLGKPVATWTYRTADGAIMGYVCRYNAPTGKEIRCWSYGQRTDSDPARWECGHFGKPRPLYGLELLAEKPDAQVIVVEGEKTADAARVLFPAMVAVTWPAGANNYTAADWSVLKNRRVVLIPDADDAGRQAMSRIAVLLHELGAAEVKGVDVDTIVDEGADVEPPKGWDLADAINREPPLTDWTPDDAMAWAKARIVVYPKTADEQANAAATAIIADAPERDLPHGMPPEHADVPPIDVYEQDAQRGHESKPLHTMSKPANRVNGESAASLGIVSRRLSDITMRNIDWLWPDKIPCGKVSMIVGNPGLGKSQVTASLAAVVTVGGKWPVSRDQAPLGSVIILSAEDDAEDTICPRMAAAGADMSRIYTLDAIRTVGNDGNATTRGFDLSQDISRLIVQMHEIGDVKLVIIDPVSAYMGKADSHNNAEVRALLAPLTVAAGIAGAAIIIVSHLNKSSGQEALLRTQGSVGFTGAARAVWGVAKDKENPSRRLFMPLKNNLGTDESGLAYSIESHAVTDHPDSDTQIHTSRVIWENEIVNMSTEEAFGSEAAEERGQIGEARDMLRNLLAGGPVTTKAVQQAARDLGVSWSTVRRAQEKLGIITMRMGGLGASGAWGWSMPSVKSKRSYQDRDD